MPTRIAGCLSLLSFAACLVAGAAGEASLSSVLSRALSAMAFTFALGLVVGWMAQKMLDENLKGEADRLEQARRLRLAAYEKQEPILTVGSEEPAEPLRPPMRRAA